MAEKASKTETLKRTRGAFLKSLNGAYSSFKGVDDMSVRLPLYQGVYDAALNYANAYSREYSVPNPFLTNVALGNRSNFHAFTGMEIARIPSPENHDFQTPLETFGGINLLGFVPDVKRVAQHDRASFLFDLSYSASTGFLSEKPKLVDLAIAEAFFLQGKKEFDIYEKLWRKNRSNYLGGEGWDLEKEEKEQQSLLWSMFQIPRDAWQKLADSLGAGIEKSLAANAANNYMQIIERKRTGGFTITAPDDMSDEFLHAVGVPFQFNHPA